MIFQRSKHAPDAPASSVTIDRTAILPFVGKRSSENPPNMTVARENQEMISKTRTMSMENLPVRVVVH